MQDILTRTRPNIPTNFQRTKRSFLLHGKGRKAEHGRLALDPKMDDHSSIFLNILPILAHYLHIEVKKDQSIFKEVSLSR